MKRMAGRGLPAECQGQEAMEKQRRRPRAIAIARTGESRSEAELIAFAAFLTPFAIAAVAIFLSF